MLRLLPAVSVLAALLSGILVLVATAATGHATAFRLGAAPVAVTVADGDPWVVVETDGGVVLRRLSARTGRGLASYRLGMQGPDVAAVTAAGGTVWAAAGTSLLRVGTARRPSRVERTRLPGVATAIAVGFGSVWIAVVGSLADELVRLNELTLARQATIRVDEPTAILAALGSIWIAGATSLERVDPRVNRPLPTATPVSRPTALAAAEGDVWVADQATAVAVDRAGAPRRRLALPFAAGSLAVARGALWVTSNCGCPRGRAAAIDAGTGRTLGEWTVGETPVSIAAGGNLAWVASFGDRTLWRITYG